MSTDKKIIIVNGIGLSGGGKLILKQFCNELEKLKTFEVILFVNFEWENYTNFRIISDIPSDFFSRLKFNFSGLEEWLILNEISPSLFVSFNNLGVKINNSVPQILYFHQSLSLIYPWSNIKFFRDKFVWFYGVIFPIVIKILLNKKADVVVQTSWMKEAFSSRYNLKKDQIHVFKPSNEFKIIENDKQKSLGKHIFFFPAGYCSYKNHIEIVKALKYIKVNNPNYFSRINVVFTIEKETALFNEVERCGIQEAFSFVGNLSYDKVCQLYQNSSALIFPSLIESFGLPLLEAASYSLKILAIESSYSREVLNGYKGAVYIPSDSPDLWAKELINIVDNHPSKEQYIINDYDTSWKDFFNLIHKKII
nr:glycosyltransferase [uncultured Flavobacterium sp.]